MDRNPRISGMIALIVVMVGQVISLLGSGMTGFALGIWAWDQTGQATPLTRVWFAFILPTVLLSPVAGVLVDRWNRKLLMMLSDLAAGLMTVIILILMATDSLQIWHLYLTNAFSGIFQAFQFPAYSAAVAMMVPKEQYARASGMISLARAASGVFAPMLAAVLLRAIGMTGILAIDVVTFIVAVGALLLVQVPQPAETASGREGRGSILQESLYGFRYIYRRPSLLGLQLVFLGCNFIFGIANAVLVPMVLSRTGNNEVALGSVQSAGAIGGVLGGLLLSIWGGPRRRVYGVVYGWALLGLLGLLPVGLGRGPVVWAVAAFLGMFFGPIIDGSNQAIWLAKVAPDVQGRVFSVRLLIAWITSPLALFLAGPLADDVFEPLMRTEGGIVDLFGRFVGSGPGSGMALMFLLGGVLVGLVGIIGRFIPLIHRAEELLPDHEALAADEKVSPAAEST